MGDRHAGWRNRDALYIVFNKTILESGRRTLTLHSVLYLLLQYTSLSLSLDKPTNALTTLPPIQPRNLSSLVSLSEPCFIAMATRFRLTLALFSLHILLGMLFFSMVLFASSSSSSLLYFTYYSTVNSSGKNVYMSLCVLYLLLFFF